MIGWIFFGIIFICFITFVIRKNKAIKFLEQQVSKQKEGLKQELLEEYKSSFKRIEDDTKIQKAALDEINRKIKTQEEEYKREYAANVAVLEEQKKNQDTILKNEYDISRARFKADFDRDMLIRQHEAEIDLEKKKKDSFDAYTEYLDWIFSQKLDYIDEIEEIKKLLEDFRQKRAAINDAILREKEIKEKEDFYRICLSEDDIKDMAVLKSISLQLRNRNAIPKLIWEVILQRPSTEMIKRVLGGKAISGIYKVTYIKTGEAYVGQSTDLKTRWQNHAKTAIGLDACASSTFHSRLAADGIENYTWEVLEEVPKDKLREREKYWIDFYETQKMGLNMKSGG